MAPGADRRLPYQCWRSSWPSRQAGRPAWWRVWDAAQPTILDMPLESGGRASQGRWLVPSLTIRRRRSSHLHTHFLADRGIRSDSTSHGIMLVSFSQLVPGGAANAAAITASDRVRHRLIRLVDRQGRRINSRMAAGQAGISGRGVQRPGARWPALWRPFGFREQGGRTGAQAR